MGRSCLEKQSKNNNKIRSVSLNSVLGLMGNLKVETKHKSKRPFNSFFQAGSHYANPWVTCNLLKTRLASNSQRSACICLLNAGITVMDQNHCSFPQQLWVMTDYGWVQWWHIESVRQGRVESSFMNLSIEKKAKFMLEFLRAHLTPNTWAEHFYACLDLYTYVCAHLKLTLNLFINYFPPYFLR